MIDTGKAAGASAEGIKKLVANMVPKFYHFYPNLENKALDAMFDFCEDENLQVFDLWRVASNHRHHQVRMEAIRGLGFISKNNKKSVPKIGDTLIQLVGSTGTFICTHKWK